MYVSQGLTVPSTNNKVVDPKRMQLNLTGFLESKTGAFMAELWGLLLSAQASDVKVPAQFIEEKKKEMKKREEEAQIAEAKRAMEQERERGVDIIRQRERTERRGGRDGQGPGKPPARDSFGGRSGGRNSRGGENVDTYYGSGRPRTRDDSYRRDDRDFRDRRARRDDDRVSEVYYVESVLHTLTLTRVWDCIRHVRARDLVTGMGRVGADRRLTRRHRDDVDRHLLLAHRSHADVMIATSHLGIAEAVVCHPTTRLGAGLAVARSRRLPRLLRVAREQGAVVVR
jgi:PWI domain